MANKNLTPIFAAFAFATLAGLVFFGQPICLPLALVFSAITVLYPLLAFRKMTPPQKRTALQCIIVLVACWLWLFFGVLAMWDFR
jgi:hypothetical protein